MISNEMQKTLMGMTVGELTELQKFCSDLKVMKNKGDLSVGQRVYVVQKTKKTPGVITKIMDTRCLVDLSGRIYRVPMTMLEVA